MRIKVNDETWIVSKEAYEKLIYTDKNVELIDQVNGEALIGKKVTNPVTGSIVPILPASFVCPRTAAV